MKLKLLRLTLRSDSLMHGDASKQSCAASPQPASTIILLHRMVCGRKPSGHMVKDFTTAEAIEGFIA
jgi:hypothetical protein